MGSFRAQRALAKYVLVVTVRDLVVVYRRIFGLMRRAVRERKLQITRERLVRQFRVAPSGRPTFTSEKKYARRDPSNGRDSRARCECDSQMAA